MKKIILLLSLVVLVSGCVGLEGIFGSSLGDAETTVLTSDILAIQNINIIPGSLLSSMPFTFSLEIKNTDDVDFVENGDTMQFTLAGSLLAANKYRCFNHQGAMIGDFTTEGLAQ